MGGCHWCIIFRLLKDHTILEGQIQQHALLWMTQTGKKCKSMQVLFHLNSIQGIVECININNFCFSPFYLVTIQFWEHEQKCHWLKESNRLVDLHWTLISLLLGSEYFNFTPSLQSPDLCILPLLYSPASLFEGKRESLLLKGELLVFAIEKESLSNNWTWWAFGDASHAVLKSPPFSLLLITVQK